MIPMIPQMVLITSTLTPTFCHHTGDKNIQMVLVAPNGAVSRLADNTEVARIFSELSSHWRTATMYFSDSDAAEQDLSYRAIVAMGEKAIPYMLRDLEGDNPEHWFSALEEITRENPVALDDQGDILRMAAAWIDWGKNNGYTS